MNAAIILLFVVLVAGAIYLSWYLKKLRRDKWQRAATAMGLEYSAEDPFGLLGLPFGLFRRGDGRGIENVVWGTWRETEIRGFDYWFYDESTTTDSEGRTQTSRDYSRFTCVLTAVPAECPATRIEQENVLTRLADRIGFRDIEFESEEFNRRFQVTSADKRFANYLVDARMMRWLLEANPRYAFELGGNQVLCAGGRIDPQGLPAQLDTVLRFVEHVPRVVREVYGGG